MKLKLSFFRWLASVFAVISLIGMAIFLMVDPYYIFATKDSKLIELFQKNKGDFIMLREMMLGDSESFISPSNVDARLVESRRQQYLILLSKIGNPTIFSDGKVAKYIYASGGVSAIGSEWIKGLKYDGECVDEEVISLDNLNSLSRNMHYCRKIEGNWWIIFEAFD